MFSIHLLLQYWYYNSFKKMNDHQLLNLNISLNMMIYTRHGWTGRDGGGEKASCFFSFLGLGFTVGAPQRAGQQVSLCAALDSRLDNADCLGALEARAAHSFDSTRLARLRFSPGMRLPFSFITAYGCMVGTSPCYRIISVLYISIMQTMACTPVIIRRHVRNNPRYYGRFATLLLFSPTIAMHVFTIDWRMIASSSIVLNRIVWIFLTLYKLTVDL